MNFIKISENKYLNFDMVDYFTWTELEEYDPISSINPIYAMPFKRGISIEEYNIVKEINSEKMFEFKPFNHAINIFNYPYLNRRICLNIDRINYFDIEHSGIPGSDKKSVYISVGEDGYFLVDINQLPRLLKMTRFVTRD